MFFVSTSYSIPFFLKYKLDLLKSASLSMVIEVRPLLTNALAPTVVTELGIVTDVKL